jgi:malate synthase
MAQSSSQIEILGQSSPESQKVFTPEALAFVAELHRQFNGTRRALLDKRVERQQRIDAGERPDFLKETAEIRNGSWKVAACPDDLQDRRVEITGPVERKMMINALNSGAKVFMADFEDSLSPTWENVVHGHINCMDAVRRTIRFDSPEGKSYALKDRTATLVVRPRGWHLEEKHLRFDGQPASASLCDFGFYFFHNARESIKRGSGPYFYLPKLESHLEARLWNDVFVHAQSALGIPKGSIRATVLIETILAAFEMEEILYELREHMAGLNAGRWDYIFSAIKKFRGSPDFILPDRAQVTMAVPFMRAYAEQLVAACHKRGAHAIGGMSAFIPNRKDPRVTESALAKVREDKDRESKAGFDGTWVAHPDLVAVAQEIFDRVLGANPNQKSKLRDDVRPDARALVDLRIPGGKITESGLRTNVDVALQYVERWLSGTGAAAIHNLMEDAATAEISRAQIWQWIRHGARLDAGAPVTADLYMKIRDEELAKLGGAAQGRYREAAEILDRLILNEEFAEFLTVPAYRYLQ